MTIVASAVSPSLSSSSPKPAPVATAYSAPNSLFRSASPAALHYPSAAAVRVNQVSFAQFSPEGKSFLVADLSTSPAFSALQTPSSPHSQEHELLQPQPHPRSSKPQPQPPSPAPQHEHELDKLDRQQQYRLQSEGTLMQPTANTIDNHPTQAKSSLTSRPIKALAPISVNSSHSETLQSSPTKRPSTDGEYHQRSYSAVMGPMGVNENHGHVRGKVPQESPSRKVENTGNANAGYREEDSSNSHQNRGNHRDMDDEEDQYEDDDMEGEEDGSNPETDEENVDELMDEAEFEEAEEHDSMSNGAFYLRPGSLQQRGELPGYHEQSNNQQQQFQQQGNRPFTSILPRPELSKSQSESGSGYGHDTIKHERDAGEDQRHPALSSWEAHPSKDMLRQGAPRNNRPLQVRPATATEMGGGSGAEYTSNNITSGSGASPGSNTAELSGGPGSANAAGSALNNSVGVNNGSSKKRTTPAKHKCPQCDNARAFSRLHDCNRHMRTHWRIKPYSCPECHRNFVRQDALTRHLRLDFGHNRCSGYPGPLPGSSNQDKTDESADDAMGDSSTENPTHSYSVPTKMEGGSATIKADTSYTSPSPTSPTRVPVTGNHGLGGPENDNERPVAPEALRDSRILSNPIPASESTQPGSESAGEREKGSRRDAGPVPHARYPSVNMAPISFVHRSTPVERRAVTPPELKDNSSFQSQHSRSFSHSSFSHGQPPLPSTSAAPLTPQTVGPSSSSGPSSLDRRNAPPISRNGASWSSQGHDSATSPSEYYHGPVPSRPPPPGHIMTRQEPPYGAEYDRQRVASNSQLEYPPSPQEVRRPTSPNTSEWNAHGPEASRSWSWDQRPHDGRHRHPTWSDSPSSRAPMQHPQEQGPHPSTMAPPRALTMDQWQRGPPPSLREAREDLSPREPRESREAPGPVRMLPRAPSGYHSSPYPVDSAESQPRPLSGHPSSVARPVETYRRSDLERDPRQRSMTEMDRVRGSGATWSEQRSRSFHELDSGMDPRSRFDPHPSSPQHARENPQVGRPSAVEASSSVAERPHVYSGMVGVERTYAQTNPYHERDLPRDSGAPAAQKPSVIKDPMARDYRPTRSYSTMEYESDRDAFHRQPRYSGEPKPPSREARRSMSPIPHHRHSGVESGRPYEGNPRYQYPSDRSDQYSREEAERMPSRPFRHEERLVASPLPREDQGGYFGEPARSNSYRASNNYPPGHRPQEPPHRHADAFHDSGRRERHSVDMPLASPTTPVGPPPAKRSLSTAAVATR
ncbi:hypothetical protein BGZ58_007538 [Dissophora ornata]|nr:hypothetical protein BGZ58_007538 [Dissophora ornata]